MKTKTITLYEYSELSKNAQERAHRNYVNEGFDEYALMVALDNRAQELLEKNHITPLTDAKGYETKYAKLYYSLSNSQGDGLMFEGTFLVDMGGGRKYHAHVRQSGHYSHKFSRVIDWREEDGSDADEETKDYKEFVRTYESICDELEKLGYEEIESLQSEDYFIEECNSNEWTFRKDGTREDEDEA